MKKFIVLLIFSVLLTSCYWNTTIRSDDVFKIKEQATLYLRDSSEVEIQKAVLEYEALSVLQKDSSRTLTYHFSEIDRIYVFDRYRGFKKGFWGGAIFGVVVGLSFSDFKDSDIVGPGEWRTFALTSMAAFYGALSFGFLGIIIGDHQIYTFEQSDSLTVNK